MKTLDLNKETGVLRRYLNPPVVEALCETFFSGSVWDATVPGIFYDRIRGQFPIKSELKQMDVQIQIDTGEAATRMVSAEPRARFASQDGSKLVQVGRDLVVVNHLRPYPQFDAWRPLVISMVKLYGELTKPSAIDKIGVRYINRIEVPEEGHDMATYFKLYPEVPSELGAAHGNFFMRLQVPAMHSDHSLMVTFGSAPSEAQRVSAYLLDLYDVVPVGKPIDLSLFSKRLDEAHANVEKAFESIITDTSRALFQEVKT